MAKVHMLMEEEREPGEKVLAHFRSSDHATRSFCSGCGSSLFFETTRSPETIDVVLANLKGVIDFNNNTGFVNDRRIWGVTASYYFGAN